MEQTNRERRLRVQSVARWLPSLLFVVWLALLFSPGAAGARMAQRSLSALSRAKTLYLDWGTLARGSLSADRSSGTVNLVMLTDYSCPYCRRGEEILDSLSASNVNLRVGYRFSIPARTPVARLAATFAACANEEGIFSEIHYALYALAAGDSTPEFMGRATSLVEDRFGAVVANRVRECSQAPSEFVLARLNSDSMIAYSLKASGTPAFLVRGKILVGVQSPDSIRAMFTNSGP